MLILLLSTKLLAVLEAWGQLLGASTVIQDSLQCPLCLESQCKLFDEQNLFAGYQGPDCRITVTETGPLAWKRHDPHADGINLTMTGLFAGPPPPPPPRRRGPPPFAEHIQGFPLFVRCPPDACQVWKASQRNIQLSSDDSRHQHSREALLMALWDTNMTCFGI